MPRELPPNLDRLHAAEEEQREKARPIIARDARLRLHLAVTEAAMEMADITRQFRTSDEDLKVIQMLAMRTFNAFAAALKLMLSGYHQQRTYSRRCPGNCILTGPVQRRPISHRAMAVC